MRERGCAVVRQGRLIALVGTFLIGCAFLLIVIGCSGTRSEAPQEEGQEHTEATKKEQTRAPEATASEEARCEGTRIYPKGADADLLSSSRMIYPAVLRAACS
jgi:hypothetical protein